MGIIQPLSQGEFMKIAFVGSRGFPSEQFVIDTVTKYADGEFIEFISGGALGVDTWAEETARSLNIDCIILKPDWVEYGKKAGIIRNKKIVDKADKIVVFWDGYSSGTKSTIDFAIKAKKPVDIFIR